MIARVYAHMSAPITQEVSYPQRYYIALYVTCSCTVAVIFVMHWQHTLDVDWLRNIGYPYLKEVAAFWSCYLVKDEHGALAQ